MNWTLISRFLLAMGSAICILPWQADASDVPAGPPTDISVTIYRAPGRASGSITLNQLNGFALISETRAISIPAGQTRIRFAGVADGIESASSILTGLPADLIEKNRDAQVLSPAALVAHAMGRELELVRTDPRSGRRSSLPGRIRSGPDGGVVFESVDGVEALHCSGLSEFFQFEANTDLGATPTLSALISSPRRIDAVVTLSYLARGFDWAVNYSAVISPERGTMNLGAWVTLANSNSASFPAAHTQVVAGRINHVSGGEEPIDIGRPVLAECWPTGTTSDIEPASNRYIPMQLPAPYLLKEADAPMARATTRAPEAMSSVARLVEEEQLGDLKLYRVPERTTVGSRQAKQVRLLDRSDVPIQIFDRADVPVNRTMDAVPVRRMVRTRNDPAHHLGLPLPSGSLNSFAVRANSPLLLNETSLRDTANDEEVEVDVGASSDLRVSAVRDGESSQIAVTNGGATAANLELSLGLPDGDRLIAADHEAQTHNGKLLFKVRVEAGEVLTIRYRTGRQAAVSKS
jgi:hypothetical protein